MMTIIVFLSPLKSLNNPQVRWSHPPRTRGSCRVRAECLWPYLCQVDFNHQKLPWPFERMPHKDKPNQNKSYKVFPKKRYKGIFFNSFQAMTWRFGDEYLDPEVWPCSLLLVSLILWMNYCYCLLTCFTDPRTTPTQSVLYDFARVIFLDHNMVHVTSSDEKSSGAPHSWQDAVQL